MWASIRRMLRVIMGDEEPIFTITEANLDSGLRGVPVGTCRTSFVDPIEGVHYVGYPVGDLANLEEEDVITCCCTSDYPTPRSPRPSGLSSPIGPRRFPLEP